jgi:hypothetical protein
MIDREPHLYQNGMAGSRILIGLSHHAIAFHARAEDIDCNLLQWSVGVPFPTQEGGNHNAPEMSSTVSPRLLLVEIDAESTSDRHVTRKTTIK